MYKINFYNIILKFEIDGFSLFFLKNWYLRKMEFKTSKLDEFQFIGPAEILYK